MREIGGYIELETFNGPILHEKALALNCGRNCLAYLFKSRKIAKIKIPYFICDSIAEVCDREHVEKSFYHIGIDFRPTDDLDLADDEWLYLVNLYGQLDNEILKKYVSRFKRVIVDQANNYFAEPLPGVDTIYTCRKWFGVSDGALLYTDSIIPETFPQDESFDRMRFLLGRFERTASEFYNEYNANNQFFASEPIKIMSKLTSNLLHGIDYKYVENKRADNFAYLDERFNKINQLRLRPATFMYPLMVENGAQIRQELQANKIYVPTLWPMVFEITSESDLEYKMADNILPLPIDQRYGVEDMQYMADIVLKVLEELQNV